MLFLLVLVSKATWGLYAKERESQKNLGRVEAELSELQLREERLSGDIARLQTSEGIETEIRGQFQVAKPGEKMIVLVDDRKNDAKPRPTERSLVSRFFDFFR